MKERFKASVSVFAIVRSDEQVLMILRSNTGWMDGCWSLPAGAIDGGEVANSAALREMKEEVCLYSSTDAMHLAHVQHNFTHGDEWVGMYFEVASYQGEPSIGEPHKHGDIGWFSLNSLPENTIPYVRIALDGVARKSAFSSYSD